MIVLYVHAYIVYDVNIKQTYNTNCERVYLQEVDRSAKNITKPVYPTICHIWHKILAPLSVISHSFHCTMQGLTLTAIMAARKQTLMLGLM